MDTVGGSPVGDKKLVPDRVSEVPPRAVPFMGFRAVIVGVNW